MPNITVDGLTLHYLDRGEGPPIFLSHGIQNSGFAFTPIIERLAKRFQVFALDKRGHGESDKPKGPYTIQNFSDDLLRVIDALNLEKIDLLGHSLGGRTATLFGIEHSDRLKRLMLVSSSASAPSGDYQKHFKFLHLLAQEKGMEAVFKHEEFRRLLPSQMLEGSLAEDYKKKFLKNTPDTYAWSASALFTMPNLVEQLKEISIPTWVCYGENDHGPLDFSDIYLEKIPNCSRTIISNSGHFPIWDATEKMMKELEDFLEKNPI